MDNRSVLLILDGMGLADTEQGSAVTPETMPFFFDLARHWGCARLEASGPPVGLDTGQAGNSETGHLNIGAGRRVPGILGRIQEAYADGEWVRAPAWDALAGNPRLHIAALLSDAGVHAHWQTAVQAAELAARHGIGRIFVHLFLDGVDSSAGSAPRLLDEMFTALAGIPNAEPATISGRRWACDRSGDHALTSHCRQGLRGNLASPAFNTEALDQHLHEHGVESGFPFHVVQPEGFIADGDPVLLSSHRADRISQLAAALASTSPVYAMIPLDTDEVPDKRVFFPTRPVTGGLVDVLAEHGLEATRIAEDCKFPHVTRFMNGLREWPQAPTIRIPSVPEPEIARYPQMSIDALCEAVLEQLHHPEKQAVIVNIPNLDQVGHTGDLELARQAARAVDQALERITHCCVEQGWSLVITADHGNADCMLTPQGKPLGSHSSNPVPLVVRDAAGRGVPRDGARGSLAHVAPAFLQTLGLPVPETMEPPLTRGPALRSMARS